MSKLFLQTVRLLRATKGRMLAIALIVATGTGIFSGMSTAVDTMIYTRDELVRRLNLADYQVNFWSIEPNELPDLSRIDGVIDYEARMILNGTIEVPGREQSLQAIFHFPSVEGQGRLSRIQIVEGRYFDGSADLESAIIDKALATYHGFEVGDTLHYRIGRATHERTIIGIAVSPEHLVATANPEFLIPQKGSLGVVYLAKEEQEELMGLTRGMVTNVVFDLDAGVDQDRFDEQLKPHFAAIEVDRYEPRSENFSYAFLDKDMQSLREINPAIILVFMLVTLLVSFVVFRQIIGTQRREIATMMALGIPKGAIIRSFLVAGAIIGLVGGIIGFLLSVATAAVFVSVYSNALGLATIIPYYLHLDALVRSLLTSLLFGISSSVLFIALPTFGITRLEPVDAARPQGGLGHAPPPGLILRALGGRSAMARFSIRNLARNRARFVMTVVSIAFALAVTISQANMLSSVDATFRDYFASDRWDVVAEYVEPEIVEREGRFAGIDGIERIEEFAKGSVRVSGPNGAKVLHAAGLDYPSVLKSHDLEAGRLPRGDAAEVVVYRKLLDQLGLSLGDSLRVKGVEDGRDFEVVGVCTFSPRQIYMPKKHAQFLLKLEHKVTGALIETRPGAEEAVAAALRARGFVGDVRMKSTIVDALRAHTRELLAVVSFALVFGILVSCLVAGAMTTLNILEREADYAMLRIQGFELSRVKKGVYGEVLVTGALGALLAAPLSYWVTLVLNHQMGQAFFYVKTVLSPVAIILTIAATILFMPIAAGPAIRRIRDMNLAESVRSRLMS